jgi:hypothetical protein
MSALGIDEKIDALSESGKSLPWDKTIRLKEVLINEIAGEGKNSSTPRPCYRL